MRRRVAITLFLSSMLVGGCRSLVDPDVEIRRAPSRVIEGTILMSGGDPAIGVEILFTNAAYTDELIVTRRWLLAEDGSFRFDVGRDFEGRFDLVVSTPVGSAEFEYGFLGLVNDSEPLALVRDVVELDGRLRMPVGLEALEFQAEDLELERTEARPAGAREFVWRARPIVMPDGSFGGEVTRAPWDLRVSFVDRGPFALVDVVVPTVDLEGPLDLEVDLVPMHLTTRWPDGQSGPLDVRLLFESSEFERVHQDVSLGANTTPIWVCGPRARVEVNWPQGRAAQFTATAPADVDRRFEVRADATLELVLPPRVLNVQVLPAPGTGVLASCRFEALGGGFSRSGPTDANGRFVYFCDEGGYELRVTLGEDTRTLRVDVGPNGADVVVDFTSAP